MYVCDNANRIYVNELLPAHMLWNHVIYFEVCTFPLQVSILDLLVPFLLCSKIIVKLCFNCIIFLTQGKKWYTKYTKPQVLIDFHNELN